MKDYRTGTAVLAGLLGCLLGGAAARSADVSGVYVGVGTASSEYWVEYIAGAKAVAGSLGLDVHVVVSDYDGQKLLDQLGAVFAAGCENCAVAADPASSAFTEAIAQRAADAGAKYVNLWNRPEAVHPWDSDTGAWVANIAFDGVDSGYQNGKALCAALDGKGQIAALEGVPDNPPAKQRLVGLKKALAECPGVTLVDVQTANWDQTQAQTITRTWLAKYGDSLNGIFAENDGMALGAVAALREKGLAGKIPVTASDGSSDALALVKSGEILSDMHVNSFVQGAVSVALAIAAVRGDVDPATLSQVQRDFYLKQDLVTKDTVDAVLAARNDPAAFTYDKMKADFWSYSAGQIPPGANN